MPIFLISASRRFRCVRPPVLWIFCILSILSSRLSSVMRRSMSTSAILRNVTIIYNYPGQRNWWKDRGIGDIELVTSFPWSSHILINGASSFGNITDGPLFVNFVLICVRTFAPNACVLAGRRVHSCYKCQKLPVIPKVVFNAEDSSINSDRSQLPYITAYILEACFDS